MSVSGSGLKARPIGSAVTRTAVNCRVSTSISIHSFFSLSPPAPSPPFPLVTTKAIDIYSSAFEWASSGGRCSRKHSARVAIVHRIAVVSKMINCYPPVSSDWWFHAKTIGFFSVQCFIPYWTLTTFDIRYSCLSFKAPCYIYCVCVSFSKDSLLSCVSAYSDLR